MKSNGLLWMALGFILALLFGQAVFGARGLVSSDPRRDLSVLLAADPELGPALVAADRGRPEDLVTWLARADAPRRQRLAVATLGLIVEVGPPGPDGRPLPDDRTAWPFRRRLAAFATVATGSQAIDHQLSNVYVYTLMAGGEGEPAEADVAIANRIADRLERRLQSDPSHEVWDTVGCARFRARLWARARDAWNEALDELGKEPEGGPARTLLEPLYRARLEAAEANLNPPPHTPPAPLPRELRSATVPSIP